MRIVTSIVLLGLVSPLAFGQATTQPTTQAADADAAYMADISKRADGVIEKLKLAPSSDKAKAVHADVVAQYRALRDWHDANDPALKDAKKIAGDNKQPAPTTQAAKEKADEITATLRKLHDEYIAKLNKNLTPEQVDVVKDAMTYNVLHVTMSAYIDMIPRLNDEQKAQILTYLTEARELAMDEGSSKEKHAMFGKYKGRINNYLAKQGINQKEEEAAWRERLKARRAAATQPATTQPAMAE